MSRIKKYEEFLLENIESKADPVSQFISELINQNVPTSEILNFRSEISKISALEESVNEGIVSTIQNLKIRFKNWLNDKLLEFLINRKKEFYINLTDKLLAFDLTNLDDVKRNFPGFKLNSMYLAGGMDEAEDTGRGWRCKLEHEFEIEHPGKKNDQLPEVDLLFDGKEIKTKPSYVIDGVYLDYFLKNPSKTLKLYDKPALLNPVRKEVDRNKSNDFEDSVTKLKTPGYDPKKDIEPINWLSKTFTNTIEPDDEHLLRIADAVFLGQDPAAGAGTYGELELLSIARKPLFCWLVNKSEEKIGGIKLWTIPHLSKVARNEEEMKTLVSTIINYNK